jgi:hypothetical protein
MIIIPELETIVITPPRTASTSLHKAIKESYPDAIGLYRHMEASGIPQGYDMWKKIGIVRQPLERLWSLYKYIQLEKSNYRQTMEKTEGHFKIDDFNSWILNETIPFVTGFDYRETSFPMYTPYYDCQITIPETKKSLFYYLRPDLGTEVFRFDKLFELEEELDIFISESNGTEHSNHPEITEEVERHLQTFFSWDLQQFK